MEDERTWRQILLALENLLERSMQGEGVFLPPETVAKWGEQASPSIILGGIKPGVGGTIAEFPSISPPSSSQEEYPLPEDVRLPDIVEGFEIREEGDKVVVGRGKYIWANEEKEFEGAEVTLPSPLTRPVFIVFNLEEGQVKVTYYPSCVEHVLLVKHPQEG